MSVLITREDLRDFVDEATERIGDPSLVTTLLFVAYLAADGERVAARYEAKYRTLFVELEDGTVWPLEISDDREPVIHSERGLIAFGMKKVRAGVWALNPSLNVPGVLHAFVVLHGVPDPAPWERLVLLASEL